MEVPNIIWSQLTSGTKMACGARMPIGDTPNQSLTFKVTINPRIDNRVKITLKPDDTYTIELYKIRGTKCEITETKEGIYVDNLNEVVYHLCNK